MSDSQLIINTIDQIHSLHCINALRRPKGARNTYVGPCVRCKIEGRGSPLGGDDRLTVKIDRPAYGYGSMYDPVFFCRQCPQDGRGNGFAGDLVAYVRAGSDMTFAQALEYIGLDPMTHGSNGKRLAALSFKVQGLSPQNTRWIEQGNKFIHTAMNNLWDPEFSDCLNFLHSDRGLSDDILRRAMVGWNEEERYEDALQWGMGKGRIRITRGFVYPEYHLNEKHEMELYSIAIRRIKSDLDDEQTLTGKIPSKTMVLADSQKSLYMASTIKRGKICFLVEGQADALSILDAGKGRWSVGATQGVTGARTTITDVLLWLSQADVVVIMYDGDEAGISHTKYWREVLPYSIVMSPPPGKDPNKMLVDGTLYAFCEMAEELAYESYPARRTKTRVAVAEYPVEESVATLEPEIEQGPSLPVSAPKKSIDLADDEVIVSGEVFKRKSPAMNREMPQEAVQEVEAVPVAPPKVSGVRVQGKSSKGNKKSRTEVKLTGDAVHVAAYWTQPAVTTLTLQPDTPALPSVEETKNDVVLDFEQKQMDEAFERGCVQCGGLVDSIDMVKNRPVGHCSAFPNCEAPIESRCARCSSRMAVSDEFGYQWCVEHRHSQRLLDLGNKVKYRGFYVAPTISYDNPFRSQEEKEITPFQVKGGITPYEHFALNGPEEQIWAASLELHHSIAFDVSLRSLAPVVPVNAHPCARGNAGCKRDYTVLRGIGDAEHWDTKAKRMVPSNKTMLGGRDVVVDETVYHFCPYCVDAAWWLEFGQALGFPVLYDVSGKQEWIDKVLNDADAFYFTMGADTFRRTHKELWQELAGVK